MSTLASISYITPGAYVHIADELATGQFCVEVSDGLTQTRVDLNEYQMKRLRDDLIVRFPIN
jgi:hypothetical protein